MNTDSQTFISTAHLRMHQSKCGIIFCKDLPATIGPMEPNMIYRTWSTGIYLPVSMSTGKK